jgi:hypothetical protein
VVDHPSWSFDVVRIERYTAMMLPTEGHGLSGVGAYPTDSYYDPARPSWLPYWIDTPTESANKYANSTNVVGDVAANTGGFFGQIVGGVAGGAAGGAIGGAASSLPWSSILVIGGVGLAALFLFSKR